MSAFLAMGGYGAYIWPAYGAVTLVLLVLLAATLRENRRVREELEALESQHGPRRARAVAREGANDG